MMPETPLTHHEIIALVGPFARRGRHVDLVASQRLDRRVVFRSRTVEAAADEPPDRTCDDAAERPLETLELACPSGAPLRLTRTLRWREGLSARLQADGPDAAALLEAVESVPWQRHLRREAGFTITRSYCIDVAARGSSAAPVLREGMVHAGGLLLTLTVPERAGMAGDIVLEPRGTVRPTLPEDLLAVLGWNWARLLQGRQCWTSKLRLGRAPALRTRRAEEALDLAAPHLARTLTEAPAAFHDRLLAARRQVFLRRGIPALTALALLASVAWVAWVRPLAADVGVRGWSMLFHLPTALFACSFAFQELPRFEVPPWPWRPQASAWDDATCPTAWPSGWMGC